MNTQQTAGELFAEYRQVLATADAATLLGRYAIRQVLSESAMSIAYLNSRKEAVPNDWKPEHDGYLIELKEINREATNALHI